MEKKKKHAAAGGLIWRSIETAPRRKVILVWGRELDINWNNPKRPRAHMVDHVKEVKDETYERGPLKIGDFFAMFDEALNKVIVATHWMPLPDGPPSPQR